MNTPGLTFKDYVEDLNRRRAKGEKVMILYQDWLCGKLAEKAAEARTLPNGRPRPMGPIRPQPLDPEKFEAFLKVF